MTELLSYSSLLPSFLRSLAAFLVPAATPSPTFSVPLATCLLVASGDLADLFSCSFILLSDFFPGFLALLLNFLRQCVPLQAALADRCQGPIPIGRRCHEVVDSARKPLSDRG